jgi:PhnB protein
MQVQPYLFFDGRCEEAIEFYKKAIGAKVAMMMRFKDAPPSDQMQPGSENKVMHATLSIGDTQVMASDGHCAGKPKFDGFSLSIGAKDDAEATKLFNALAEGGEVRMPLGPTFFASKFGMLADRFGVGWMIIAGGKGG